MRRGRRQAAQPALTLKADTVPAADISRAKSVRFTKDFTCNVYGAPYSFYKAGTVISNAYMIGLLVKAKAPIEAI